MLDLVIDDFARLVTVIREVSAAVKRKPVVFVSAPRPSDRRWQVAVLVPSIPARFRSTCAEEAVLLEAFPEAVRVDGGLS
jgi:hypothetical protein